MEITPVASDSMGTRSMATFIETDDVTIFLDPAVSLAPSRWHLPPHEKEQKKRDQDWHNIRKKVQQSDIAVITHFHYDHYNPRHPEIFTVTCSLFYWEKTFLYATSIQSLVEAKERACRNRSLSTSFSCVYISCRGKRRK